MDSVYFLKNDYCDAASYDNYRKISSFIDGLKPSARKCVYTMLSKNITDEKKLEQLKSTIAEHTCYIHGADSLVGVFVNLARNYVGTNNIPLFTRDGHFGNRMNNEHAAARYISSKKEKYLDYLFLKDDINVLIEQLFEGEKIEPKYFVPILPLILVNGSKNSVSYGFAQHILPRNPEKIKDAIFNLLDNKEPDRIMPWHSGFQGRINKRKDTNNSYEFLGVISRNGLEITITELPIGYDWSSYIEVLNKLEERKVITSYKDLCDTKKDLFKFIVKIKNQDRNLSDEELMDKLKLITRDTENFTTMNEDNRIQVFDNEIDLLKKYLDIRLYYYQKRKDFKIKELKDILNLLSNKLKFLKGVINNEIILVKKTEQEIIEQLENNNINKINDSFDYILSMQFYSLTKEKMNKLIEEYRTKKEELKNIENKDIKEWYKEDINEFFKIFNKKEK